jgi:hypothetical protein
VHIGQESQASLESSNRIGKGLVDLLRSRGCHEGRVPTYF